MRIAMVGTRGVPARYGGFETAVEEIGRRLAEVDPEAAANILVENGRRVVRALEVVEITGRPFSATLPTLTYADPRTAARDGGHHPPRLAKAGDPATVQESLWRGQPERVGASSVEGADAGKRQMHDGSHLCCSAYFYLLPTPV